MFANCRSKMFTNVVLHVSTQWGRYYVGGCFAHSTNATYMQILIYPLVRGTVFALCAV